MTNAMPGRRVTAETARGGCVQTGLSAMLFFFKRKTACEISECDWSSDVCSSDLIERTRLNPSHKQKTAYEISECDWSSDECSSDRSEEHTSELQSHSEISYAVFCL